MKLWLSVDNMWLSWERVMKRGNGKMWLLMLLWRLGKWEVFMKLLYNTWVCMIEEWEIGMYHGLRELLWVAGIYIILWNNIEERKWEMYLFNIVVMYLNGETFWVVEKSLHCICIKLLFLYCKFWLKISISWKKIKLWYELWKCKRG